MAVGPWVGGIILDTFNDYRWLYIGSLSIGLGAMAVALAFPPLRSRDGFRRLKQATQERLTNVRYAHAPAWLPAPETGSWSRP
jgi:MFS family permease